MTETILQLNDGEAALFGYGSLLSVRSMERTLGRAYQRPFIPCELRRWRRTWDIAMPNQVFYAETPTGLMYPENILYLNVCRDSHADLNGILFVVNTNELEAFDRREWIYDRENVTSDLCGVTLRGGDAYLYVGKPQYTLRGVMNQTRAAVRRTYLEIVEAGLSELGDPFRLGYERSTDPVPISLIIDDHTSN